MTKRSLGLLLRALLASVVVGMAVGGAAGSMHGPVGAVLGALGAAISAAILAGVIGGAEIILPRTRLGRALERAPFLVAFTGKWLAYGGAIVLVVESRLGRRAAAVLLLGPDVARALDARISAEPVALAMTLAFMVSFTFNLVIQLGSLIGQRTLRDIVLGRYHRPRSEERFFLFVDIAGSTALAERIGPHAVHRFLGEVFRLASDPIEEHEGEVFQYVGDEIVITWTLAEGRTGARAAACFFAIERALARSAREFEREFGAMPRLRGALHAGPVISGEVGGSRRAIVYHGDVMNTASRIEQATRDLDRQFLASHDAVKGLAGLDAFVLEDLGLQYLRGRSAPMRVYAISVDSPAKDATGAAEPRRSDHAVQRSARGQR